jgi:hypothetical protein
LPIRKRGQSQSSVFSSPFAEADRKRLFFDKEQLIYSKPEDQKRSEMEALKNDRMNAIEKRKLLILESQSKLENESHRFKAKDDILRERNNLKNEDVPQEEIDLIFPLPSKI